jgi:hypothetical protein
MDLLFGIKGFLPVLFFIVAAAAITSNDLFTKIILAVLSVGILVGLIWEPAARFLAKHVQRRNED